MKRKQPQKRSILGEAKLAAHGATKGVMSAQQLGSRHHHPAECDQHNHANPCRLGAHLTL
jgi:hypothetical protein